MPAPEEIYKHDVDFTALALQYPDFSKKLKTNRQLDFSDPESVRQLTKALLHRDFGLVLDLPEDRLCPPVPNRFNYVLFAQRLIDSTSPEYGREGTSPKTTIGLDIGTGASAIYPLLACSQRPSWAFLATEIDAKSRLYAERNIDLNKLRSRIKILDTDKSGRSLIPMAELERFDDYAIRIQITNPPFYSSKDEMTQSAKQKARPPNSACTGAPVEMIVEGGEVAFVRRLIHQSSSPHIRSKIQWFSSMLGKLSSVSEVIEELSKKTRRWCVAWSWHNLRPPTSLARGIPALDKKFLPFPNDFDFDVAGQDIRNTNDVINAEIAKLDLEWRGSAEGSGGIGYSPRGDVWSRKARRRKMRDEEMNDVDQPDLQSDSSKNPSFAFQVAITPQSSKSQGKELQKVNVRWLQGHEIVVFESFCGWLKRRIQSSVY